MNPSVKDNEQSVTCDQRRSLHSPCWVYPLWQTWWWCQGQRWCQPQHWQLWYKPGYHGYRPAEQLTHETPRTERDWKRKRAKKGKKETKLFINKKSEYANYSIQSHNKALTISVKLCRATNDYNLIKATGKQLTYLLRNFAGSINEFFLGDWIVGTALQSSCLGDQSSATVA